MTNASGCVALTMRSGPLRGAAARSTTMEIAES
jgi:hypothetical protein